MAQAVRIRKARRGRSRRSRVASVFGLWMLLLFCSVLAGYFFINSAFFGLQYIVVEGNAALSDEEIIAQSGLALGTNLFKVDTNEAAVKIRMYPVIKRIEIERKLPATLNLKVEERIVVARIVDLQGFIEVDGEGVYIRHTTDQSSEQLPVISGISLSEQDKPGAGLSSPGLVAALELIRLMDESFLDNVARIIAASPESLTLQTTKGVEVRFGKPEDLERKIAIMQNLLVQNEGVINSQTVEYIDLRYDTSPVIKRKS